MKYESIADIFSANRRLREGLIATLAGVTPDEATTVVDGEGWTVGEVAEHVAIVGTGIAGICAKLLAAAQQDGRPSDGSFAFTEAFGANAAEIATRKLEAPDRVKPSGMVDIHESLERLTASTSDLEAMQSAMETFDLTGHTFPHPYFGQLTAAEWLVVAGRHERRHTKQIQRLLERIRN